MANEKTTSLSEEEEQLLSVQLQIDQIFDLQEELVALYGPHSERAAKAYLFLEGIKDNLIVLQILSNKVDISSLSQGKGSEVTLVEKLSIKKNTEKLTGTEVRLLQNFLKKEEGAHENALPQNQNQNKYE